MRGIEKNLIIIGAVVCSFILISTVTALPQIQSKPVMKNIEEKNSDEIKINSEGANFDELFTDQRFIDFMTSDSVINLIQSEEFLDFLNTKEIQDFVHSEEFMNWYKSGIIEDLIELIKQIIHTGISLTIGLVAFIFGVIFWIPGGIFLSIYGLINGIFKTMNNTLNLFLTYLDYYLDEWELRGITALTLATIRAASYFIPRIIEVMESTWHSFRYFPHIMGIIAFAYYWMVVVYGEDFPVIGECNFDISTSSPTLNAVKSGDIYNWAFSISQPIDAEAVDIFTDKIKEITLLDAKVEYTYNLNFGDGKTEEIKQSKDLTYTTKHEYETKGSYKVKADTTVTIYIDSKECSSYTQTVEKTINIDSKSINLFERLINRFQWLRYIFSQPTY